MSASNQNPYQTFSNYSTAAAFADSAERAAFIRRTYAHLAFAVALFALVEAAIFILTPEATLLRIMATMLGGPFSWLLVIGAFMLVGTVANAWARSGSSPVLQYMGLILYAVAEAVIFIPLIYLTSSQSVTAMGETYNAIAAAGVMTGVMFGGLTLGVFLTRADLSGIGKYLGVAGLAALGFIVCSMLFGFHLGVLFNCAIIALMCGYILYYTSNVLHHYRTDQHVAAALALFASVATLFYYILLLFGGSRD